MQERLHTGAYRMYEHMARAIGLRYTAFDEGVPPSSFNAPMDIDAAALAAVVEIALD
jgi:hypothetical protein